MGLADLTGELMRNAINSLATGNTEVEFMIFFFSSVSPFNLGVFLSVGAPSDRG